MKRISLVILSLLIFSCNGKPPANNPSNTNTNEATYLMRQKELVQILEENMNNPSLALKKLELYYKKYSIIMKRELQSARQRNNIRNEYQREDNATVKKLILRQQAALKKILKVDRNFYVKMSILMRKHGL